MQKSSIIFQNIKHKTYCNRHKSLLLKIAYEIKLNAKKNYISFSIFIPMEIYADKKQEEKRERESERPTSAL